MSALLTLDKGLRCWRSSIVTLMSDKCYLCRSTANTRDHIPPKGFFPIPGPDNLITVPCCKKCNQGWSLDDDEARTYLTLEFRRSNAADWIWQEKVLGSTMMRRPRFREEVLSRVGDPIINPLDGSTINPVELPEMLIRFVIRVTKGLIRNYFPDYDYSSSAFDVKRIEPTDENLRAVHQALAYTTRYDERGDGVIRYRYGISDTGHSGIWFIVFYDANWYLVQHVTCIVSS
jgi:hypothetical protein